jgi:CRISPR system Cascade subunit CasB
VSKLSKEIRDFVRRKIALLDKDEPYSKAACAKLRRALGKLPEEPPDVWEITLQGAPEGEKSERAVHTCLALYALHRQGKSESVCDYETGFGTAISTLIARNPENETAIRRRFNAVATSVEFTELAHHARGLVQLLKSKDIKMDYPRFAGELYDFQFQESQNRIRLNWGKQFYRVFQDEKNKIEGTEN